MSGITIRGIENMSIQEVIEEIERGGKFVMYQTVTSLIFLTLRNPTAIHFIKGGDSRVGAGLGYTARTFFLGWWGIPWGLIYTPIVLISNLCGGKNVTEEVVEELTKQFVRQQNRARLAKEAAAAGKDADD